MVTEVEQIAAVFVADADVVGVIVAEVVEEVRTTNLEDMKHFITDQKGQSNKRQSSIISRYWENILYSLSTIAKCF